MSTTGQPLAIASSGVLVIVVILAVGGEPYDRRVADLQLQWWWATSRIAASTLWGRRVAFTWEGRSRTYAELSDRTARIAAALAASGRR